MDKKISITERILQFVEFKGITKYKFCKDLGFSTAFLDKPREISTDKYANILLYFPDVSPEWLLTGKGEMLRTSSPDASTAPTPTDNKDLLDRIQELAIENHELKKRLSEVQTQKKARTVYEPYSMVAESELEFKSKK